MCRGALCLHIMMSLKAYETPQSSLRLFACQVAQTQ
jgi:hypothetical protein